jgi:signal transduction protein with GAF and PtsI domain
LRHFARAVELNDSYLRGYYGLKLMSQKLLPLLSESSGSKRNAEEDDVVPPKPQSVKKLEEIATAKLGEIVRQFGASKQGQSGYYEAEIIAARELLNRDGRVER